MSSARHLMAGRAKAPGGTGIITSRCSVWGATKQRSHVTCHILCWNTHLYDMSWWRGRVWGFGVGYGLGLYI